MKIFKNAKIYVEGKGVVKTNLAFNDRIMVAGSGLYGDAVELPENAVVVPGFIDEHIHGAYGSDGMDGTVKDISTKHVGAQPIEYVQSLSVKAFKTFERS